jgi:hypothetical protein
MTDFAAIKARDYVEWVSSGQAARDRAAAFAEECEAYRRGQREPSARTPPPPATSGRGCAILDGLSHQELDAYARRLSDFAFHHIEWPRGWKVFWAALDGALGRTFYQQQWVLIDHARHRGRPGHELIDVLIHELSHVVHRAEVDEGHVHGPRFRATLDAALSYVTAPADAPQHPEPIKGRTFGGRPVTRPGWGELEYR